ncbi:MAG: YebC/PmpR family DNA-binding transcriptional regulator, partial [Gammaproteobacteria bacterium]|nr:YebC/PmpR family DNA-binding transcriptional regulator [Gammaproteobacteria bacterium]
ALLEADVDVTDIETEDGRITLFVPHTEHYNAKQNLLEAFGELDFQVDEIQYLGQTAVQLSGEDVDTLNRLYDMLDDLDDVQNIYHNAQF